MPPLPKTLVTLLALPVVLDKMKHGALRCRAGLPDFASLDTTACQWDSTPCGNVTEETPSDPPCPLGHPVITTACVDANLHHDLLNGHSVTGIVHLINHTIIDWHSKKQNTCETSTCGSEFVAARMVTGPLI